MLSWSTQQCRALRLRPHMTSSFLGLGSNGLGWDLSHCSGSIVMPGMQSTSTTLLHWILGKRLILSRAGLRIKWYHLITTSSAEDSRHAIRTPICDCDSKFGQRRVADNFGDGVYRYEESALRTAIHVVTTVIASLLPHNSVRRPAQWAAHRYHRHLVGMFLISPGSHDKCSKDRDICRYISVGSNRCLANNCFESRTISNCFQTISSFAAVNVVYLTNGAPCAATAWLALYIRK